MLVEFSVKNFRSIKDLVTFSMVASPITEHRDTNVFQHEKVNLLKSAVIYGANASGKSNLVKAMHIFKNVVLNSAKDIEGGEQVDIQSFKLSTETEALPSFFEIIFYQNNIRYRYGCELDSTKVHKEWLYFVPKRTEAKLFTRIENEFSIGTYFKEGKGRDIQSKTRPNALFLSVVAVFNGEIATEVWKWFRNFNVLFGLQDHYMPYSIRSLSNEDRKREIVNLLKSVDLGIENMDVEQSQVMPENLPPDLPDFLKDLILKQGPVMRATIYTFHKKYDENKSLVGSFIGKMPEFESEGTIKAFALSGPLLDTLQHGKVLIVDELDSRLHPLVTRLFAKLFNSTDNTRQAQLIFNTHDTNLLDADIFRRDQIWFTEKDRYGCTDLYSLVEYELDFKKIRKDASYRKDYMFGRYGGIPVMRPFNLEELYGDRGSIQEEEKERFIEEEGKH